MLTCHLCRFIWVSTGKDLNLPHIISTPNLYPYLHLFLRFCFDPNPMKKYVKNMEKALSDPTHSHPLKGV
jgi:hypothetical protein